MAQMSKSQNHGRFPTRRTARPTGERSQPRPKRHHHRRLAVARLWAPGHEWPVLGLTLAGGFQLCRHLRQAQQESASPADCSALQGPLHARCTRCARIAPATRAGVLTIFTGVVEVARQLVPAVAKVQNWETRSADEDATSQRWGCPGIGSKRGSAPRI